MVEPYIDIQSGNALVHIEGVAGIDNATKIHQVFIDAVESHLPIILDVEHMTECDSSFIQLVRSLCYTLNREGCSTFKFSQDHIPDVFKDVLKITGLQFHSTCTRLDTTEGFCCKTAQKLDKKQGRN